MKREYAFFTKAKQYDSFSFSRYLVYWYFLKQTELETLKIYIFKLVLLPDMCLVHPSTNPL